MPDVALLRKRADWLLRGACGRRLADRRMVAVAPSEPLAASLNERRYLAKGRAVVKAPRRSYRASSLMQRRCHNRPSSRGRHSAPARSPGLRLPIWQRWRVLAEGEVFSTDRRSAAPLDCRIFWPASNPDKCRSG
jgi:type IV secretory pathway protease TraF